MEEKREPLSEMAIERKIQILRNKHMDSEVIALVKSDYEYGLTDDEIGLYLNKSYDIEQMKVLSKCLHKGVSEELLTLLKDSRMAAPKMQTALDYYEKGVPIDAIREVVQKDDTAVNMRRMFDVVLDKLNKAKEQMPQDLEYVKSLVAQMDEVVAKINHQNERYDALNKKLSEIETSKDDEEVRERLVKENQDKDALINSQQNELNKASSTIARLRDDIEKKDKEIKRMGDRIESLEDKIGVGKVASISGRYYAMDRDNRWDRVQKAYNAIVMGQGNEADNAIDAIDASYKEDVTDEFVVPTVIMENGAPVATLKENDSVIFYNFRPDRAREITRSICDDKFDSFDRPNGYFKTTFVCFTEYDVTIPNKLVAFHKVEIKNTFGEFLAQHGLKQLRLAETEKYAHVTFFFNGGVEEPNEGEDRILVKSPAVATYDLQPEMSAPEVGAKLVEAIKSDKYDVIIMNFANSDMVGHTGIEEAAIKAVEAVDKCVGDAVEAIKEVNGQMFICADHGNAEQLKDYETGAPFTAHTTNPVPFILVNAEEGLKLREGGCLADIVPTLIELMGMEQPAEMTGKSLIVK